MRFIQARNHAPFLVGGNQQGRQGGALRQRLQAGR